MAKIKYQGTITKTICSQLGKRNKKKFADQVNSGLVGIAQQCEHKSTAIDVASFSSNRDFYDQVLSILSFIRYVGTPRNWTLYSDGSHTDFQRELVSKSFPFLTVKLIDWDEMKDEQVVVKERLQPYKKYLIDYVRKNPLGKKLFYYLNHSVSVPTLFLDSDILFYTKSSNFDSLLAEKVPGWFLPDDEWSCLDSRYKSNHSEQMYQINSGFFLLPTEIANIESGMEFLKSLNGEYEYFSEQTTFHILFRNNGFMPFDPRIYVLNSGDQFDFSYMFSRNKIGARHYTGPVRHKMWQRDWKWQLSFD